MKNEEKVEPKMPLSASRIKTCETCSWLFYAKYILGIPDRSNDGASKGSVTHLVMELLGDKEKRGHYFEKIIKAQDIDVCPSISRLIYSYAKKLGVHSDENIFDIKQMCLAGLNYDFYAESDRLTEGFSEIGFNITKNEGGKFYKIRGFLDKLFLYDNGRLALIRDFKTSKKVYVGKEISDNIQHFIYSLAARELFPQIEQSRTEFLFLKHGMSQKDSSGVITIDLFDNDILDGFEYELTNWQILLDSFCLRNAYADMACYKDYPKDGSFGGPLSCGFAKSPNQLKKDGTPMWYCPAKFAFDFYKIKKIDSGETVATCFLEDKPKLREKYPKDSYFFEWAVYSGCPHYCRCNY